MKTMNWWQYSEIPDFLYGWGMKPFVNKNGRLTIWRSLKYEVGNYGIIQRKNKFFVFCKGNNKIKSFIKRTKTFEEANRICIDHYNSYCPKDLNSGTNCEYGTEERQVMETLQQRQTV